MFKHYIALVVLVAILSGLASCNIWDNMYSHSQAKHPIHVQQSISFDFTIPQYNLVANLDFNRQLQLATLTTYVDLILTKVEALKAQIDLKTLVVTSHSISNSCQKFKLEMLAQRQLSTSAMDKSALFFINILFKYVGKVDSQGKELEKYKFQPFLFGNSTQQFDQVRKEIQNRIQKQIQDQIDKFQSDVDFDIYILTDPSTGKIQKIVEGKKSRNIPFKLSSSVKTPVKCNAEIKVLSNQDLANLVQQFIKNMDSFAGGSKKPRPPHP